MSAGLTQSTRKQLLQEMMAFFVHSKGGIWLNVVLSVLLSSLRKDI